MESVVVDGDRRGAAAAIKGEEGESRENERGWGVE
jgi:hypothetical protein